MISLSKLKLKSKWRKIFFVMAAVVVFVTTYMLILPALTLEADPICGIEEHSHSDSCYSVDKVLVCTVEETEGHAHSDECYEELQVLVCSDESEEHEHGDTCYSTEKTLVCTVEETEGHTHSDECYEDGEKTLTCAKEEHIHIDSCYPKADEETSADWEETFADVDLTGNWSKDVLEIAKSQLGYSESTKNYITTEDGTKKGYTRYGDWYGDPYGDWCAMYTSFCLHYADVDTDIFPLEANCQRWIDILSSEDYNLYYLANEYNPRPGDLIFFNNDNDEDADHIGFVVEIIAATETDKAKVKTIEGNSSDQVKYNSYDLDDEEIIGYGKLPINPEELNEDEIKEVEEVISLIDDLPTADEFDAKLAEFEENEDDTGYENYYTEMKTKIVSAYQSFAKLSDKQKDYVVNADKILEFEYVWSAAILDDADNTVTIYQVNSYKDQVTANFLVYGGSVGEKVTYDSFVYWHVVVVEENTSTGKLYVSQYVKTVGTKVDYEAKSANGFVFLYHPDYDNPTISVGDEVTIDFNYKVDALYYQEAGIGTITFNSTTAPKGEKDNSSKLTTVQGADTKELITVNLYDYGSNINDLYKSNKKYPGFQQDFGQTSIETVIDTSYSNFGNNITEDYDAGIASLTNNGGSINATTGKDTSYGNANIPISGAISSTLGSDGYPALSDGTSLKYLFSNNTYATKQNTQSINGLFKYNEETGAYTFNSRENHAQYNSTDDTFTLYKQIISSNFIMYPFGNFLPFNDIVHESAQVSTIDRAYLLKIVDNAHYKYQYGAGDEYYTLATTLKAWIDKMDAEYPEGWDAGEAINEYFNATVNNGVDFNNKQDLLDLIYSIDFDEETDFFFGMDMYMEFVQPKGGLTGKTGQEEMVFYFTGDDDVWVYIDNKLFLDLSGIHRHVGGEIDFVNGVVKYYNLDPNTGDVATTPYETVTFEEILGTNVGLNSKGTFEDYSSHKFNFYYMERGAGSGVCRMNFNFPLLKQHSISVAKELSNNTNVIGDPDFTFQILSADSNGVKSETPFIGEGITYNIYDSDNNLVGQSKTKENGIFTLKAGQRAEFEGIDENKGKYYVREIFDDDFENQYGQVSVNGTIGVESDIKDISEGATIFTFNNQIDQEKLGILEIKKELTASSTNATDKEFSMIVTIDGHLLSSGTKYSVGSTEKTVDTVGIIKIKANETAIISGILAGSEFSVKEDIDSGINAGYNVSYTGENLNYLVDENKIPYVSGIIQSQSSVNVVVKNTEGGVDVKIPVTKVITQSDGNDHTFEFILNETDENGNVVTNGFSQIATMTLNSEKNTYTDNLFDLVYVSGDQQETEKTYYYKISEKDVDHCIEDTTEYLVSITITKDNGELKVSNIQYMNLNKKVVVEGITFTNTLSSDLTLTKKLEGSNTNDKFEFTISLVDKENKPVSGTFSTIKNLSEKSTITFGNDGKATVTLKQNETITIKDIPYNTTYTIEENAFDDNYDVSYQIGENAVNKGTSATSTITIENENVVFTNYSKYALPETGGSGTYLYTIGGISLMLISFIVYRILQRKNEVM